MCIKHGFGIHFPFDNKCPSCDNETYLYISAEDILSLLQQQREEILREVEEEFSIKYKKGPGGWLVTGVVIRIEYWNKFKKSLSVNKKV